MTHPLPTTKQLETLPLRAVVAYASRTARRLSSELRGIIADDVLDSVFQLIESVSTTRDPRELDGAVVIRGAERVTAAYAAAPEEIKSLAKFRIVFSITHATITAMAACQTAADPTNARLYMKRAVGAAQRAVRAVEVLDNARSTTAAEAARRDYETLLAAYGEHEEPILGDPVHCFDNVPE